MKILLVSTDFLPNVSGIATLSYEQASGLSKIGHVVTVLTSTTQVDYPNYPFKIITVKPAKWRLIKLLRLFIELARLIFSLKPDFIWCTNYRGFALPVFLLCKLSGVRYGMYLHGTEMNTEYRSPMRRWVFIKICMDAKLLCTNSENSKTLVFQLYQLKALKITPGVNRGNSLSSCRRSEIRSSWFSGKESQDYFYLLSACRLTKQKGIELVLQALAKLPEADIDIVRYIIAGSGPQEAELKRLTNQWNLNGHVLFIGPKGSGDLSDIYAACDCYIQPSQPDGDFLESYGISYLEAQAHGLPCIATQWGGIPEAVLEGETAILVQPGSVEEIADAILSILGNEIWNCNAKSRALEWAAKHSWSDHVAHLNTAIGKAMRSKAL